MKILLAITILFHSTSYAKKTKKKKRYYKKKDYYEKNAVDRTHEDVSKRILALSNSIDAFFAGESYSNKKKNKSQLKLSLDTYVREGAGPYAIPDLNYRLVLPNTQRRLQVFIENEDEDKEKNQNQSKIRTERQQRQNDDSDLSAGLRYMVQKSGVDFSFDTGVLVNVPVVVFTKFTAKKSIEFTEWILKIWDQVKWVNNDGFTNDLDLNFDKRLRKNLVLRMVNNVFWNDQDYTIRFENGPSLLHKYSRKIALGYHAHVISINSPEFMVDSYVLQINYRQKLYKKWLFFGLTPFVKFPRVNNFHRTPGLVISFDAKFGHL